MCVCSISAFSQFLSYRATHSSRSSSSSYSAQLAVVAVTAFLSSGGVPSQLQPHHFLLAKVGPVRRVFSACVAVLKQPSSNCIETYGWPCTHNSSLTNSLPLQKIQESNQRLSQTTESYFVVLRSALPFDFGLLYWPQQLKSCFKATGVNLTTLGIWGPHFWPLVNHLRLDFQGWSRNWWTVWLSVNIVNFPGKPELIWEEKQNM